MSDTNHAYNDRSRYWLQHNSYPRLLVDESEIEGWNDDDKEYARNEGDYDGVFAKFSNNLKFFDSGKDFIKTVKSVHGINARIRLIKEIKDENDIWGISYTGLLDLVTFSTETGGVLVKFNSSGLQKTLQSREKEKVEIERVTDLDGNAIPELELKELELPGRRIFLDTKFNTLTSANQANCTVESNAGNTRSDTCGLPLNLYSQSHDNAHSVIPQTDGDENQGSTGMMFYANNDRDRLLQIDLDFALDAFFQQYENVQWCFYRICLTTYKDGVNYNLKNRITLDALDSGFSNSNPKKLPDDYDGAFPQFTIPMSGTFSGQIELLQNESLALECYLKSDMYVDNNAGVRCFAQNINANLRIQEDSSYPLTTTKGCLAHELFDRLLTIKIARPNVFKSSIVGRTDLGYPENGRAAFTFNSHGMWNRRFDASNELYKPFATSFRDAFDSYNTGFCLGLGIESVGYGEKVVIEDKRYFYNPNVTVRLGKFNDAGVFEYSQVSSEKRNVADKKYFSAVNIGSEKGGDYESVMGLQETNTRSNFFTYIDAVTNVYDMIAKYRFDPYGQEIIRRRGIETHPDTDQSGDSDIWMNDVKAYIGNLYKLKTWEDVLESAPIGMFHPDSSYNFIFSPVQMLLEHDWILNAGLQEYPNEKIVFGSSTGKSAVIQKRIGKPAYAENGNIPNSDLRAARYTPMETEFEHLVDDDLMRQIEGSSTFFGKKIPNVYGLFEFLSEETGLIEKGFLQSVKPNNKGKFKLLLYNR